MNHFTLLDTIFIPIAHFCILFHSPAHYSGGNLPAFCAVIGKTPNCTHFHSFLHIYILFSLSCTQFWRLFAHFLHYHWKLRSALIFQRSFSHKHCILLLSTIWHAICTLFAHSLNTLSKIIIHSLTQFCILFSHSLYTFVHNFHLLFTFFAY